ncbi:MAG: PQQ-binding-like beta-propeller repeat protein [Gemmatimonadota bacterium]|nr:MAG: PQQ-binding-like beta-propeller repeat protein [Gemmatimonadota bacterium]
MPTRTCRAPLAARRCPPNPLDRYLMARAAKIDSARRGVKFAAGPRAFLLLGLAALPSLASCTYQGRPAPTDAGLYWPTYLGNAARAPFLRERVSDELPGIVWSSRVGSGIQGMPVVTDEAIIAASSDRYIHTLSRQDGSTFWRKRVDGLPVSPMVVGEVIYTATTTKSKLRSLRITDGDNVWNRRFPAVSVPLSLVGDTVYAATEDAHLFAVTRMEQPLWSTRLSRRASAGPLVLEDWVAYVSLDSLFLLERASGRRRAAAYSPEVFAGEAASDGEKVYLATEQGSLLAWRTPDLELVWQTSGFGSFHSGPVLAGNDGYAVTRTGEVVRFDADVGSAQIIARTREATMAPPTVVQNGLLVGTLAGRLHFFSRNGEPIWDVQMEGSIEAPVFVHGGRITVPMYGRIGGPLGTRPSRGKVVELR